MTKEDYINIYKEHYGSKLYTEKRFIGLKLTLKWLFFFYFLFIKREDYINIFKLKLGYELYDDIEKNYINITSRLVILKSNKDYVGKIYGLWLPQDLDTLFPDGPVIRKGHLWYVVWTEYNNTDKKIIRYKKLCRITDKEIKYPTGIVELKNLISPDEIQSFYNVIH